MTHFISKFLEANVSDEKLAKMLDKARAGGFTFEVNDCFLSFVLSIEVARTLPYAVAAEYEYCHMAQMDDDEARNALLIPVLEAEIARRCGFDEKNSFRLVRQTDRPGE